jgi:hypothetical protein
MDQVIFLKKTQSKECKKMSDVDRKVIKVEVPKDIWDADMSIWNWRRDIMGSWMKSIKDVIKQMRYERS